MKGSALLKPDKQGRVTLPRILRAADFVSYSVNADGSVLLYPVEAVRAFPDMSDLPEVDEIPKSMKASLQRSLRSTKKGIYAASATQALRLRKP